MWHIPSVYERKGERAPTRGTDLTRLGELVDEKKRAYIRNAPLRTLPDTTLVQDSPLETGKFLLIRAITSLREVLMANYFPIIDPYNR